MTPFHIRRRLKSALTSMPGPMGTAFSAVLGRDEPPAPASAAPPSTGSPGPRPVPEPPRPSAVPPVPDPRADRDDEDLARPKKPAYTPDEEAALKSSTPTPRPSGSKNALWWQVAKRGDLAPGQGRTVKSFEKEYALFNVDGEFHAIESACPHAQLPLAQGELAGKVVTCDGHGWAFDVTTGECVGRAGVKVGTVPVRFDGDRILLPG